MSQRPATSGPQSNPSSVGNCPYTARDTPRLPPIVSSPKVPSPNGGEHGRNTMGGSPRSAAPPRESATASPSTEVEQSGSRTIKMHNILNPSNLANDMLRQRMAMAAQADTSPITVPALSRNPSESSPESSSRAATPGTTLPPLSFFSPTAGHGNPPRLMTPNSLIRGGINVSGVNMPNATIDAKATPFLPLGGQVYTNVAPTTQSTSHLGATLPIAPKLTYGYTSQKTNTPPDRRSGDIVPQAPPSQSNSPSTSYSSYSHPSHASPAPQYTIPASQAPTSGYYGALGSAGRRSSTGAQITLGSDSSYGPVTSAGGQSTYQLMTLDTDQGPIQVPVDVQAASKMADEKRKRNAGASARFRQRRKEKEREASVTIAKLETQIRELGEEREYYRVERDYFRGIVYSTSAQGLVAPRLPSPRQRKSGPAVRAISHSEAQWEQSEESGGQTGRNTRRRISSYTPTYEIPPPAIAAQAQPPIYSNPSAAFAFPKSEPRAPTPLQRSTLPSAPQRFGPFDPPGPPTYERAWTTSQ
ncbi:hypothetical protein MMC13_000389 [Lambiella insularis]|nr:hypothetical protein [Lambiella insularis]